MDYSKLFADRMGGLEESAIREIFKVLSQPGMISLAGGMPDPSTFPLSIMSEIFEKVLEKYGPTVFQYGLTEGFAPLREAISKHVALRGIEAEASNVFISSGAQGAINAASMLLINKGDKIALEAPTFLASIKTFKGYQPDFVEIETDSEGVIPDSLEELLSKEAVKFVYLIPTFQNPTGRTLSLERRTAIAEILIKYQALAIEDDPYFELRYDGQDIPSINSLAPENVIYIGSLSKTLSPGMRLGYYIAPSAISSQMVSLKQGIDVHTSVLDQAIAAEFIEGGYLAKHLPVILETYKPRKNAMLDALQSFMPESASWSKPDGGMFVWVEGAKGFNAREGYQEAIKENVAFVPGCFFYVDDTCGKNSLRLSFTSSTPEDIERGVSTIAQIMKGY